MYCTSLSNKWRPRAILSLYLIASMAFANPALSQENPNASAAVPTTATPIQHVIVLIGENRTFDHVFGTYVPRSGDSISNLRSNGIINADGTPGPHFSKATQYQAIAPYNPTYFISLPPDQKVAYDVLPEPTLNFAPIPKPLPPGDNSFQPLANFPPGTPTSLLAAVEPSLEAKDLQLLTTGVQKFT